jgi:death-on-curing protein
VSPEQPNWLLTEVVLAIQEEMLREHGGLAGVRDRGLLDSALARPQNLFAYQAGVDVFALAAGYAFGIVRNHPFVDGNKRTAFVSAVTFLEENGCRFQAPEREVVAQMIALAEGALSEDLFASWLRENSAPPRSADRT